MKVIYQSELIVYNYKAKKVFFKLLVWLNSLEKVEAQQFIKGHIF